MSETPEKKKIIVDEDWKTQVEAEREALAQEQKHGADATDQAAASPVGEMPPASFEMLITTLATEAMVALGQIPHPATGKREFHPPQARYFIDTLAVLEKKTQGNLSPQENEMLSGAVNQLRLAFVSMREAAAAGPGEGNQKS